VRPDFSRDSNPVTTAINPALTRRALLGGAAIARVSRVARARDRRPNLLFIMADDHAGYVLGAAGNPRALTPNLDRLASEGTRFARHFCNSPVCTPSRQSILTGQLPHSAGVTVLATPLDPSRPTIARTLSAGGFSTAVIGKMHFNRRGEPGLHGFQTAWTEDIVQKRWLEAVGPAPPLGGIRAKPEWHPFQDPARIWLNAEKLPFPRRQEQMKSAWVAAQASRYLEEHKDDRFALWVSFQEPHSPFDFPIEWREKFRPADFPVPRVGPEDHGQIPLIFRDLTPAQKQGIIAAYYTSVNYLDHNVGVVLAKLRELNLENDTLVIYMADHGYSLGQHGRFEKHCTYDPALEVPLLIRFPGRAARRVVHDFTESIDVAPTIFDLLGAPRFDVHHGQSLRPYLVRSRPERPRSSIFSEYLENEEACVRTARWKYAHGSGRRERTDGYKTDNPTPGRTVRLYDLKSDPGEFTNVAAKHPEVAAELSHILLERFRATHPEASSEPAGRSVPDAIEWYLRPRDAPPAA
jgi:choline-sulfatase